MKIVITIILAFVFVFANAQEMDTVKVSVSFGYNSSKVTTMPILPMGQIISIEGYASVEGNDRQNQILSQRRAYAVASALGVEESNTIIGFGETTQFGELNQNRVVVITILVEKTPVFNDTAVNFNEINDFNNFNDDSSQNSVETSDSSSNDGSIAIDTTSVNDTTMSVIDIIEDSVVTIDSIELVDTIETEIEITKVIDTNTCIPCKPYLDTLQHYEEEYMEWVQLWNESRSTDDSLHCVARMHIAGYVRLRNEYSLHYRKCLRVWKGRPTFPQWQKDSSFDIISIDIQQILESDQLEEKKNVKLISHKKSHPARKKGMTKFVIKRNIKKISRAITAPFRWVADKVAPYRNC